MELNIPNLHKYLQIIIIFFNCYYHYCAVMNIWSKNHSLFLAEHFVISTCTMYPYRKSSFCYSAIEMWLANIFNRICFAWCLCFYATHNKKFLLFFCFMEAHDGFCQNLDCFEKSLQTTHWIWIESKITETLLSLFQEQFISVHRLLNNATWLNNINFIDIRNKTFNPMSDYK